MPSHNHTVINAYASSGGNEAQFTTSGGGAGEAYHWMATDYAGADWGHTHTEQYASNFPPSVMVCLWYRTS